MRTAPLIALILLPLAAGASQDLIVDVNLRTIDVAVEDGDGRPVLNLTADDFEVSENGRPQRVAHLSLERKPIALGLLVDRSSSIRSDRKNVDRGIGEAMASLLPDDQVFLMTFAGDDKLRVRLTTEHSQILREISKTRLEYGSRVYDAITDSLLYLSSSGINGAALIVFSDGADHYSRRTFEQLLSIAATQGSPVYTVSYAGDDSLTWSEAGRRQILREMEQLAELTGGKTFVPKQAGDCARALAEIANRTRYEYRLGFYSSERFPNFSDIQVRVRDGSKRVTVRSTPPPL